jgi:transcriptional regulator with XRE-family HTH domain
MMVGMDGEQVGLQLRRTREGRKQSIRRLADSVGLSATAWSDLERGKHPPSQPTQLAVARAMEWPDDWFDRLLEGVAADELPRTPQNDAGLAAEMVRSMGTDILDALFRLPYDQLFRVPQFLSWLEVESVYMRRVADEEGDLTVFLDAYRPSLDAFMQRRLRPDEADEEAESLWAEAFRAWVDDDGAAPSPYSTGGASPLDELRAQVAVLAEELRRVQRVQRAEMDDEVEDPAELAEPNRAAE